MKNKLFRFIIVVVITTLLIFVFYGKLIKSLNNTFFASSGDGLYTYIGAQYFIKYDTTLLKTKMFGYPYEEMIFFNSSLPVYSNIIKFISNHLVDISDYTVGIINFLMIFSILLSVLFLYLIFLKLKLPFVVSLIAAISIAFLTPELDRFGGHFALSFVFFIPLMIYMIFRFNEDPVLKNSLLIFLIVFVASLTHFYYYGFFSVMFLFFWVNEIFINKSKNTGNWKKSVLHLFIQWILPFLVIQMFYLVDAVKDRTTHPWGFMYYRAYPHSVLLPFNRWYGHFFHKILNYKYINWEGFHFVGLVASIGFFIVLFWFFIKIIKKKYGSPWRVTDNRLLNVLFWSSVLALLYSWGVPFVFGLEGLLEYLGPVRQMRGIGRFAWVFFYLMNIVAVYKLWQWKRKKNSLAVNIIVIFVLLFLCYDAWLNVRNRQNSLNKAVPELSDRGNTLPENGWVNRINPEDYQAIIPLPYLHVGSENIWIKSSSCYVLKPMLITTYKTSIPTMGVLSSRYSIGHTYKQYGLFTEPYHIPEIFNDFKNTKPLLICKVKGGILNEDQERLVNLAEMIDSTSQFKLYQLKFQDFYSIFDSLYFKNLNLIDTTKMYHISSFWFTQPIKAYIYKDFNDHKNKQTYHGSGSLVENVSKQLVLFNNTLPFADTAKTYTVSFWFGNLITDLYGRTKITYHFCNSNGKVYHIENFQVGNKIKIIDNNWALIEHNIKLNNPNDILKITLQNNELRNKNLVIDELLIIPKENKLVKIDSTELFVNNRFYFK